MTFKHRISVEDMEIVIFFVHNSISSHADFHTILHNHPHYELNGVSTGTMQFVINNVPHILESGNLLIIPPGVFHEPHSLSPTLEKFSVEFYLEKKKSLTTGLYAFCRELLEQKSLEPIPYEMNPEELISLPAHVADWEAAPRNLKGVYANIVQSQISVVVSKAILALYHAYLAENTAPDVNRQNTSNSPASIEIHRYICARYNRDPSIGELADHLCLSVRQVERIIKTTMQTTFVSLLNAHRISLATHKIRHAIEAGRKVSLNDISAQVGYSTYNYFLEQFKTHTGSSPLAYKRQCQEEWTQKKESET